MSLRPVTTGVMNRGRRLVESSRSMPCLLLLSLLLFVHGLRDATAGQLGFAGFLGYGSYAMDDLNDAISGSSYGGSLEEIEGGVAFGGGLRYRASPSFVLGLDYERLTGSSAASAAGGSAESDDVEVDASGSAITATAHLLLSSSSRARFGVAAGLGYYTWLGGVSGFDLANVPDEDAGIAYFYADDNALGFHFGATADVALARSARLEMLLGFRVAKTMALGMMDTDSGGEIDWTGLMTRVGLAYFLGWP